MLEFTDNAVVTSLLLGLPCAEGHGLMHIYTHREIPSHRDDIEEEAQRELVESLGALTDPVRWPLRITERSPVPAYRRKD